jgi:Tol biopolymer transport system component
VHASGLDGSSVETLPGALKAAFSPDGRWLVFEEGITENQNLLSLSTTDLKDQRKLENIGNQFLDYSWSPDGSKLSILTLDRSDYSGQWIDTRSLVINTTDMGTKILPAVSGVNPRAVWSPDSASLLLTSTQQTAEGYSIHVQVMDTTTGTVRDLTVPARFKAGNFVYTTRIHWSKPVQ